jgi:hypothetical protein
MPFLCLTNEFDRQEEQTRRENDEPREGNRGLVPMAEDGRRCNPPENDEPTTYSPGPGAIVSGKKKPTMRNTMCVSQSKSTHQSERIAGWCPWLRNIDPICERHRATTENTCQDLAELLQRAMDVRPTSAAQRSEGKKTSRLLPPRAGSHGRARSTVMDHQVRRINRAAERQRTYR